MILHLFKKQKYMNRMYKKILEYSKIIKMVIILRRWNYWEILIFPLLLICIFHFSQTLNNKNTTLAFNKNIIIKVIISKYKLNSRDYNCTQYFMKMWKISYGLSNS